MRKYLFWIVFYASHFSAQAQEPPVYSQFFINPYIYNPAYAGIDGHTVISAMYRQQWVGLDGAPTISHVTFHTPLKGGIGVGAFAFNENQSAITSSGVKGSVSYLANFDRKHWIRFGLSLGAGSNSLNLDGVDNPSDPAFASIVDNGFYALGDFGMTYHSGNFNFGVSMPSLFRGNVITRDSFAPVDFKPTDNLFLKANYHVGFLNDNYVWEPHVLYRYSSQNANQLEVANIIHVLHHIWFGASYRQAGDSFTEGNIVALFGIKVLEKLAIGYAFELGDSKVNNFTGNTHEIHIGFHLGSKKEHAEHVSSFIKRHRKTAEERKAEADERRLAALEGLGDDPEENSLLQTSNPPEDPAETTSEVDPTQTTEETDPVNSDAADPGQTDENLANPPIDTNENVDVVDTVQPTDGVQTVGTPTTENQVDNTQTVPGTDNPIDQTLTNDDRTPDQLAKSDEPLRVRSGSHLLELMAGNYVINGAFREFDHAEDFSDKLFEQGFHDIKVGYVTATGYYYVVVNSVDDAKAAMAEAKRMRGRNGFEKSWVLSVE